MDWSHRDRILDRVDDIPITHSIQPHYMLEVCSSTSRIDSVVSFFDEKVGVLRY
jgi:hypothetical protein